MLVRSHFSRLLLCSLFFLVKPAGAATPAQECLADLDFLPAFVFENDAGARDHIAKKGQAVFDQALAKAREQAQKIDEVGDCLRVLGGYLGTYRAGHLGILPIDYDTLPMPAPAESTESAQASSDPLAPQFQVLSHQTALVVLPTFNATYQPLVEAFVKAHLSELASHPNLIIDVRRNNGGSVGTYDPILPLLRTQPYRVFHGEYLVTPATRAAYAQFCTRKAGWKDCAQVMAPLVDLMKRGKDGEFASMGQGRYVDVPVAPPLANPRQVAVLIDQPCGSACELFVLAARQSFKVKVFGRPTSGTLDYADVIDHVLPSGHWRLFYATSRLSYMPEFSVDLAGLQPDILLLKPQDEAAFAAEIEVVRQRLENTSWK